MEWKQGKNRVKGMLDKPEEPTPDPIKKEELEDLTWGELLNHVAGAKQEERTTSAGLYQIVPHALARNKELNPNESRVLSVVRSYSWGTNACYQSVPKIARDANLGTTCTRNCLQGLVNKKFLTERRYGYNPETGKTLPTEYKPTGKIWGHNGRTQESFREEYKD